MPSMETSSTSISLVKASFSATCGSPAGRSASVVGSWVRDSGMFSPGGRDASAPPNMAWATLVALRVKKEDDRWRSFPTVNGPASSAPPGGRPGSALGRPPATTHAAIERTAFALFERQGFEATTLDDIAAALGVGRRTLFRYYPSKNDILWGRFDASLRHF